ncbi:sensor histidine kinase [Paraburkholderia sp. MMS20-SJTN17]|uniref:histidine kinase n=1 Tax=Paraburkholderia translucens TaxID=2886945 RepID=A0ABS8KLG8_9BURK|nr:ATP-binding protein [Paraburkholderia sp. MMS20-SJTN17]MCC8405604.1 sensor histidine kinase [Paraburkholderia sp. MMS20-SJTN17]
MTLNPGFLLDVLLGSFVRSVRSDLVTKKQLRGLAARIGPKGELYRGSIAAGILLVAISQPIGWSALLMLPSLSDDPPLVLVCLVAMGLALLSLAQSMNAFEQRSSIDRLAAAIAQRGPQRAHEALAMAGSPAIVRLIQSINHSQRHNAERAAELLDMLAAYAHDQRTPLTRIALRCEQIGDRALREAIELDLEEVTELVDASIACARMQCSATERLRCIDADGLISTLIDNYKDAGSAVVLEGHVGCPIVACPHALRRVLVNLIDNALRYGSDVRLCVRVEARQLILAVRDSGPGIELAEMEAVFAPWYRAPQTALRAPGSGLGLATARRLTLAMRGKLELENRSSGGLEARLTLPLTTENDR